MTTNDRSAEAYERLARISAQAELAESISYDFVKLKRAIEACNSDLFLMNDADQALKDRLADMEIFAIEARRAFRAIADTKTKQAIEVNERIQNGVYNG